MRELLVIADDLPGASDCGVACASHGLNTIVVLEDTAGEIDADVPSVDGNTRHLSRAKAAAETAKLVRRYIRVAVRLTRGRMGDVVDELVVDDDVDGQPITGRQSMVFSNRIPSIRWSEIGSGLFAGELVRACLGARSAAAANFECSLPAHRSPLA